MQTTPPAASAARELTPILLAIVAEKTGYPLEMIDPAMDLEADLGIDFIKRVEILSAMRTAVADLPQVPTARMAAMRTLAQILELMGAGEAAGAPGASAVVASPSLPLLPRPSAAAMHRPRRRGPAPRRPSTSRRCCSAIVADNTGYPQEMIDLAMDMEADLGIDSIKRVEILSAMRQAVPDLPAISSARMAAMCTLGQIVELMTPGMVAAAPVAASVAVPTQSAAANAPTAAAAPANGVAVALGASSCPLPAEEPTTVTRMAVRAVPAAPLGFDMYGATGLGAPVVVTPEGGGVAAALVALLRSRGVQAVEAPVVAIPATAGGVIFLGGLRAVADDAAIAINREAFVAARRGPRAIASKAACSSPCRPPAVQPDGGSAAALARASLSPLPDARQELASRPGRPSTSPAATARRMRWRKHSSPNCLPAGPRSRWALAVSASASPCKRFPAR